MNVWRYLCLAALLTFGLSASAASGAKIGDFFGSYHGWGFATDQAGPFIRTERDFSLTILPLETGGFEIAWTTVKRKGSDRNTLEAEVSENSERFSPPNEAGTYHAVDRGNLLEGDTIGWARLEGNVLTVYRIMIESNGIPELHVYRRMLTSKGLELHFTASRDGKPLRSVRGRYRR